MNTPLPPIPDRRADGEVSDLGLPHGDEGLAAGTQPAPAGPSTWESAPARPYEPPVAALGPLFRARLERIHACRVRLAIDLNTRPTTRVLGGYYKSRRLVRVYTHDRKQGRRPLDELFDTFLHEVAHHLEYTEPQSFAAQACARIPGRMHSRLFWRILGELKQRWADLKAQRRG
jgi:hypothetical protein